MATDEVKHTIVIEAELSKVKNQFGELERTVQSTFKSIESGAVTLGRSLAGIFSVGAIVSFGKNVVDVGDKLSDLSDQTGITIATLGGIRTLAEQSGTSIDAFATGILRAQKNLGTMTEDGQGAAESLKKLGLNVEALKRATPEEFLQKFATALGTVENRNERTAIAFQVLGKAGAELIPVILQIAEKGLPQLSKETAEAYKKLGELADQFAALKNRIIDLAALPLAQIFSDIRKILGGSTEADRLSSQLKDVHGRILAIERDLQRLAGANDPIFERQRKQMIAQLEVLGRQQAEIEKALKAAEKPAPPAAKGTLLGLGAKSPAAAEKSISELEGLRDVFAGINQEELRATQAGQDLLAIIRQLNELGMTPLEKEIAGINQQFDLMREKAEEAFRATKQAIDPGLIDKLEFFRRQQVLKTETGTTPLDTADTDFGAGLRSTRAPIAKAGTEFRGFADLAESSLSSLVNTLTSVATSTQSTGDAFRQLGISVAQSTLRMITDINVLKPVIEGLLKSLSSGEGSGMFGGITSGISSMFSGISGMFGGIGSSLGSLFGALLSRFTGHEGGVVTSAGIRRMHSGGLSGDEFPAILQNGEFVLRRSAVNSLGVGNLAAMNRGARPSGVGGEPNVSVIVNGDITPARPGMTKEQIIEVVRNDFDSRGLLMNTLEQRTSLRR